LALLALAQPAVAADMPVKAPAAPVAAPVDWTGFYVGAAGGWLDAEIQWTQFGSATTSDTGWLIGGTLGANRQFGRVVLGLEGDLSWVDVGPRFGPNCSPGPCGTDLDWLGTIRARVGLMLTPSWLVYGTGGLAVGKLHYIANILSVDDTKTGWTAGVGTEVMLSPQWSAKAEYLHVDFGEATTVCGAPLCPVAATGDYFRSDIVRVGLNYHFGAGVPAAAPY
jgi:outer membrane immunogenic protein